MFESMPAFERTRAGWILNGPSLSAARRHFCSSSLPFHVSAEECVPFDAQTTIANTISALALPVIYLPTPVKPIPMSRRTTLILDTSPSLAASMSPESFRAKCSRSTPFG